MASSDHDVKVVHMIFDAIQNLCPPPMYDVFKLIESCQGLVRDDFSPKPQNSGSEVDVHLTQEKILFSQATKLACCCNDHGHRDWSEAKWLETMAPIVFRALDSRYEGSWDAHQPNLYWWAHCRVLKTTTDGG